MDIEKFNSLASSSLLFVIYIQISMSVLIALAEVGCTFDWRKPDERNTGSSSMEKLYRSEILTPIYLIS